MYTCKCNGFIFAHVQKSVLTEKDVNDVLRAFYPLPAQFFLIHATQFWSVWTSDEFVNDGVFVLPGAVWISGFLYSTRGWMAGFSVTLNL